MSRLAAIAFVLAACGGGGGSGDAEKPPHPPSPFDNFATTSPKVGDKAPPFELRSIAPTGEVVRLADVVAKGPVVLVSGSFSCPLFRMKAPRFEELARRWQGVATVLFVYVEEAHPKAAASERLNGFAEQVRGLDKNGDGAVTGDEYGTFGPRYMFDAFDVDHDGIVRSHEIIAAKRIDQFEAIEAPKTLDERIALARRFRSEVPGAIVTLVDPIDNPTAKAYGPLPNFAYVIGPDGTVRFKQGWAAARDVERELRKLANRPPPSSPVPPPDLSLLAEARATGKQVLVQFVAPGCDNCRRADEVLEQVDVQRALRRFELVKISVDEDPGWRLFESLGLAATPAFVVLGDAGQIARRAEGQLTRDRILEILR